MGLSITFLMPYLTVAGGNKTVGCLGDELIARGHSVRLVYPTQTRWPPIYRPRTFLRHARVYGPDLFRRHGVYVGNTGAEMVPIRRHTLKPRDVPPADVVIGTWWETVELLPRLSRAQGVPVHYVQADEPFFAWHKDRARAAYSGAAYPICVAGFLRDMMIQQYGHPRAAVVPNGLEPRFDAPPRERNARPAVGVCFSNYPLKGAAVAFEAVRRAEQRMGRPIHVVSFGSDTPDGSIELPRSFDFHFKPPQHEIPKLHARADLWIVPSTSEGFSLPGLEAAGCRCPVVSTRCGGPAEYLREGETGYFVDVGDAEGMSQAIERILTMSPEAWKTMSEQSYRVARTFSWSRSAELFEKALYEAVEQAR